MHSDVTLYAAFAFDPEGDNDCLTDREGGVFVWSERTMTKLADCSVNGSLKTKQLRLICCAFELVYSVMMDIDDVIKDGVPMQQFIGPITRGRVKLSNFLNPIQAASSSLFICVVVYIFGGERWRSMTRNQH